VDLVAASLQRRGRMIEPERALRGGHDLPGVGAQVGREVQRPCLGLLPEGAEQPPDALG
jgi:hypothetical protein